MYTCTCRTRMTNLNIQLSCPQGIVTSLQQPTFNNELRLGRFLVDGQCVGTLVSEVTVMHLQHVLASLYLATTHTERNHISYMYICIGYNNVKL